MITHEELGFNLLFLLLLLAVIVPPHEFQSAGFTVESLFSKYLGSEQILFIQYHINRSCLMLTIHSVMPILYFASYFTYIGFNFPQSSVYQYLIFSLVLLALALPVFVFLLIMYYKRNKWNTHPIARILTKYSNSPDNAASWTSVASEINAEYRRNEKLVKRFSAINKIIVTENWIMKTSLYFVHFAHQSDTAVIAVNSDSHNISIQDSNDSAQFVNIQVKPTRQGVKEFTIRINSLDFKDLQDRINRPITVLSSVKFHTTIIDKFTEVFIAEIKNNPKYSVNQENLDACFACMSKPPDVKIKKNCIDQGDNKCTNCFCRPMWCSSCLARWFASRQNQSERDMWLRAKCTCPMCRSTFCVLDVCFLEGAADN